EAVSTSIEKVETGSSAADLTGLDRKPSMRSPPSGRCITVPSGTGKSDGAASGASTPLLAISAERPSSRRGGPATPSFRAGAAASAPSGLGCIGAGRSEEHTSELQSRENLVCRLLLE